MLILSFATKNVICTVQEDQRAVILQKAERAIVILDAKYINESKMGHLIMESKMKPESKSKGG